MQLSLLIHPDFFLPPWGSIIWIMESYFRLTTSWWICSSFLSSKDINWWTGVVVDYLWILWCFYQLFGLSFWRPPIHAEHPLLTSDECYISPNLMKKQTHIQSWMVWGWAHFIKCSFLGHYSFTWQNILVFNVYFFTNCLKKCQRTRKYIF